MQEPIERTVTCSSHKVLLRKVAAQGPFHLRARSFSMNRSRRVVLAVLLITAAWAQPPEAARAEPGRSTRVASLQQHVRRGDRSYPYREKVDYILEELDLQPGDVVVDIGAGDGWWTERMAKLVGEKGLIHAGEVDKKKLEQMKKKFANVPQVKPYLCPKTNTGLPENSCDLAFFSQSYHHLALNGHVEYLRHLRTVVKPTGRVVVIEKNAVIATQNKAHGTPLSRLLKQAEEAGWIAVRCQLITGTYHYIAIFVQKDLFPPEPEPKKEDGESKKKDKLSKTSDGKSKSDPPTAHTTDSLETVQKMLADNKAVLVDVREPSEWDQGHLKDAVLVPLSQLKAEAGNKVFAQKLAKTLPKDKIIYCHCRSGARVLSASPILKKLGYDTRPLRAGYDDLLRAGFVKDENEAAE